MLDADVVPHQAGITMGSQQSANVQGSSGSIVGHLQPLPELPGTYPDLGHILHKLRGGRSLREAAQQTHGAVSRSALQRYEQGERLPLEKASALDQLYKTDGWVAAAVAQLELPAWRWPQIPAASQVAHRWPATWAGWVWVAVRPNTGAAGKVHQLRCRWGPWVCAVTAEISDLGIALLTGKASEEQSVIFVLTCDRLVRVMFGVGSPDNAITTLDISRDWTWWEPGPAGDVR